MSESDQATVQRLRADPDVFVASFLDRRLWDQQSAILHALRDGNVSVRSGNGCGKTTIAAAAIIQWMMEPNSIAISTAPTSRQVESVLWAEVRSMLFTAAARPIRLPSGQIVQLTTENLTRTGWAVNDKWFALGLSTDSPERFSGFHADRILAVIDEASGVPQEIFDSIRGCCVGPRDRILAISNPSQESGFFYDLFNDARMSRGWRKFHLNCETLPWVVNRTDPPARGLTTWQWVEGRKQDWGQKFPAIYAIRVRGEFASEDGQVLLSRQEIKAATKAQVEPGGSRILAVDVAVSGVDETILCWLEGFTQTGVATLRKSRTNETTGFIVRSLQRRPVDYVVIDAVGVGVGVFDRLCELRSENKITARIVSFQGSERANNPDEYLNRRAESYFQLAERIKAGTIRLLDDDVQTGQLAYQPYAPHSDGRLKLLSKEQIKSKGRGSPDRADALAMGCWLAIRNSRPWPKAPKIVRDRYDIVKPEFAGTIRW